MKYIAYLFWMFACLILGGIAAMIAGICIIFEWYEFMAVVLALFDGWHELGDKILDSN